jgi:hypothetical protein
LKQALFFKAKKKKKKLLKKNKKSIEIFYLLTWNLQIQLILLQACVEAALALG